MPGARTLTCRNSIPDGAAIARSVQRDAARLRLPNRPFGKRRPFVEIKCVETLLPIHQAQILTYMKLSKIPVGLIINFNVTRLQNGIKRFVL